MKNKSLIRNALWITTEYHFFLLWIVKKWYLKLKKKKKVSVDCVRKLNNGDSRKQCNTSVKFEVVSTKLI